MNREQALNKAKFMICGQREQDYGSPEDNFATIADLWMIYIESKCCTPGADVCILPEDVAMMMTLFKTARLITGTAKEDSYIDLIGYAACAAELATNRESAEHIEDKADKISEYLAGRKSDYAGGEP